MSKAEERGKTYALHKASEKLNDCYGNAMLSVVQFDGYDMMSAYETGYHQAEKDLELTWEDIERIDDISIRLDGTEEAEEMSNKEFYQEVLKRFKDLKK